MDGIGSSVSAGVGFCVCVYVCFSRVSAVLLFHQQVPVWSCTCRTVRGSDCDQYEWEKDRERVIERTQQNQPQIKPWLNPSPALSNVLAYYVLVSLTKCIERSVQNCRHFVHLRHASSMLIMCFCWDQSDNTLSRHPGTERLLQTTENKKFTSDLAR